MLSPGEAVIPAEQSEKYGPLIASIVADNIPGYRVGNIRRVRSRSDLGAEQAAYYDRLSVPPTRNYRGAETSRGIIDQHVPGGGEELQAILAEGRVGKEAALRIMSQGADVAADAAKAGVDVTESYTAYLEIVRQQMERAARTSRDFIAKSEDLRLDIEAETGYVSRSRPKGDNVLAHIGSQGEHKFTAEEIKALFDSGKLKLQGKTLEDLEKIIAEDPQAKMDLKTGFGITGITQETNRALANEGAPIEKFTEELALNRNLEEERKTLEGGV
jgi:hypothetical protein